jgi:hypothetical protein
MKTLKELKEHIIKTKSGYKLVSKSTGKNLGTASSLEGIKKREREVQYFKHMHEDGGAMGGSAGPANVVGGGAIAGTGGKGGEPGVSQKRKRKVVLQPINLRAAPKM